MSANRASLMDLPTELRQQIYDEIISTEPIFYLIKEQKHISPSTVAQLSRAIRIDFLQYARRWGDYVFVFTVTDFEFRYLENYLNRLSASQLQAMVAQTNGRARSQKPRTTRFVIDLRFTDFETEKLMSKLNRWLNRLSPPQQRGLEIARQYHVPMNQIDLYPHDIASLVGWIQGKEDDVRQSIVWRWPTHGKELRELMSVGMALRYHMSYLYTGERGGRR